MTAKSDSRPFGYIYYVHNTISGKCYVGQTTRTIEQRWGQHCSLNNKKSLVTLAVAKYGPDAFVVEELDTAESRQELNAKEVFYIKLLGSRNKGIGYNLAVGGGVVYRKLSDVHKARIGAAHAGRVNGPHSEEHKQKIAAAHRGVAKNISPEAKLRMDKMLRTRVFSESTLHKMSESHKGKKQSEELIAKRVASRKGYQHADATKQKMSDAAKGVAKSDAHRASLRAASKLRWDRYRLEKVGQI